MTKSTLLFLLFTFSFCAFSNSPEEEQAAKERIFKQYGVPEKKVETPVVEKTLDEIPVTDKVVESPSTTSENSLDKQDIDLNVDMAQIEEMAKNVNSQTGSSQFDGGLLGKIMNEQMKSAAAQMMKSNPFKMMSDEDIKSMLIGRFKPDSAIGKFFTNNPKAVDGTVEWIKDERAIPSFISILNQPKKMEYFGYTVLSVFVIAFILNLRNGKKSILKRIFFKIGMMLCSAAINFGAFYYFFHDELEPTIKIITKYI